MTAAVERDVVRAIRNIADPEIPVISIDDLGIVRRVTVSEDVVHVVITPTYSGCPAMTAIAQSIAAVARGAGYDAEITTQLSPAWTTDWMSDQGRIALQQFGITPPGQTKNESGPVAITLQRHRVACPLCGSTETEELSRFGATACKSLRRCLSCREPFEEFKTL